MAFKVNLSDGPLDYFQEATVEVLDWLSQSRGDFAGLSRRCRAYWGACEAVEKHELWDGELRHMPHVGYDRNRDSEYFIFKLSNNGTTFIVEWEQK